MRTKDRRAAALGNSLKAEEEAVKSRFERAETALARNEAPSETTAKLPSQNSVLEEETRVKRDSFTMPMGDYELIAVLQKKCLKAQVRANKSEILRAGLMALVAMSDEDLARTVEELPRVKTGRPPSTTL